MEDPGESLLSQIFGMVGDQTQQLMGVGCGGKEVSKVA